MYDIIWIHCKDKEVVLQFLSAEPNTQRSQYVDKCTFI